MHCDVVINLELGNSSPNPKRVKRLLTQKAVSLLGLDPGMRQDINNRSRFCYGSVDNILCSILFDAFDKREKRGDKTFWQMELMT